MTHIHRESCQKCSGTGRYDGVCCEDCDGTGEGLPIPTALVPDELYEGE